MWACGGLRSLCHGGKKQLVSFGCTLSFGALPLSACSWERNSWSARSSGSPAGPRSFSPAAARARALSGLASPHRVRKAAFRKREDSDHHHGASLGGTATTATVIKTMLQSRQQHAVPESSRQAALRRAPRNAGSFRGAFLLPVKYYVQSESGSPTCRAREGRGDATPQTSLSLSLYL